MTAAAVLAALACGLVRLAMRLFAPTVTVARINGVWLATVVGVLGRREYVRSSNGADRLSIWRSDGARWAYWWRDIRTGEHPSFGACLRFDGLVRIDELTKPLRELPP